MATDPLPWGGCTSLLRYALGALLRISLIPGAGTRLWGRKPGPCRGSLDTRMDCLLLPFPQPDALSLLSSRLSLGPSPSPLLLPAPPSFAGGVLQGPAQASALPPLQAFPGHLHHLRLNSHLSAHPGTQPCFQFLLHPDLRASTPRPQQVPMKLITVQQAIASCCIPYLSQWLSS